MSDGDAAKLADAMAGLTPNGKRRILLGLTRDDRDLIVTALRSLPREAATADQIVGQIEERFPNWKSYCDLIDCIDCTLHDLRAGRF